jgi:hypothetical protein
MSEPTVKELHDKLIEAHKAFYIADPQGQLNAMVIAIDGSGQQYHFMIEMGDEVQKAATAEALRAMFKMKGVIMYAFIAEAWMAAYRDKKVDLMPSQREDRKEVVITIAVGKDGTRVCSASDINRDWETGGAVLSEPDNMGDQFAGRFADLFDDSVNG